MHEESRWMAKLHPGAKKNMLLEAISKKVFSPDLPEADKSSRGG
jgi:hypothetical protein